MESTKDEYLAYLYELRAKMAERGLTEEILDEILNEPKLGYLFLIRAIKSTCSHSIPSEVSLRYQVSHWDGLIIASALEANCNTLYSQDLRRGLVIENKLTIVNPFI